MNSGVLQHVHRRLAGWLGVRVALRAMGAILALALFAVLADALLDLPEGMRAAAWWFLAAALAGAAAAGYFELRQLTESRMAGCLNRLTPALATG